MNRILVVVFDDEPKAYEGKKALQQLDAEGSVVVYASAVIGRTRDGTPTVREQSGPGPLGTILGTMLGTVIGLLGGPTGAAIGATAGLFAGGAADLESLRIGTDFLEDVKKALAAGKFAVVADVEETSTAPVDTRMEGAGGTVFRRSISEVRDRTNDEDTAAIKADIAGMKAEHAEAQAQRKAKLQERLDQLDSRLAGKLQRDKDRREAAELTAQAKAALLRTKAAFERRSQHRPAEIPKEP